MIDIQELLATTETIAVFGCSPRDTRTSHRIARYLQEHGYRVVPINPHRDEILGETCYPDLQSVPDDVRLDVVDIFRQPRHTADAVRDAAARAGRTGNRPVVWTQLGVSSKEAARLAAEAALPYVENRCILVEHQRYAAG